MFWAVVTGAQSDYPCYDHTMTDTSKPQADKFRDMARELEADEDEARFEEAARKVATAPIPTKPEPEK